MHGSLEQLQAYIRAQAQLGVHGGQIRHALLQAGWNSELVDYALGQVGVDGQPPARAPQPAAPTAQYTEPAQPAAQPQDDAPAQQYQTFQPEEQIQLTRPVTTQPVQPQAATYDPSPAFSQQPLPQQQSETNDRQPDYQAYQPYEQPAPQEHPAQFNQPAAYVGQPAAYSHPTQSQQYPHAAPVQEKPADITQQNTDAPQKYRVFRAIADTLKAIKNNFLSYILSVLIGSVIAGVAAAVVNFVAFVSFFKVALSNGASTSVALLMAGYVMVIAISGLVSSMAYAVFMSVTALSLAAGAERKKMSFFKVMPQALRSMLRVTGASMLVGLMVLWPLIAAGLFTFFVLLTGGTGGGPSSGILGILLYVGALIWIILALLRYILTPLVALFEPDLPLTKTLKRSKHLMFKGGQWFVFKGYILILLLGFILIAASGEKTIAGFEDSTSPVAIIGSVVLLLLANGALVMLYRNRRAVRQG